MHETYLRGKKEKKIILEEEGLIISHAVIAIRDESNHL
jgi:hypothetical protein